MNLTKDNLPSFTQAELNTYDLKGIKIDKDRALKEIAEEILSEWEELNSEELMNARADHFKIPNTQADDYSERIISLTAGRELIYGIRHMGGNRDIPFIFLRPNFEITSSSMALEVYEKIKHEFNFFKPLYVSFMSTRKLDVDFIGSTYMVTKARVIKKLPVWPEQEKLELRKVEDDSYYEWYRAGYAEFHNERPELAAKVTVNSLESMRESVQDGLMFEVFMDDQKIGLIAGEKSEFLGHSGIYFHEIFVARNHKGQGLAKAIQKLFVEQVATDDDFIWGTIDSHNIPSFKTAQANARKPIRFECFVRIT